MNGFEKTDEIHIIEIRAKIATCLKEIREKKGLSQEQLAKLMQISRTTVTKIEGGKYNFSIDYLSKFSYFLGFEINLTSKK